jgi:type I restriction enzyme S subunit
MNWLPTTLGSLLTLEYGKALPRPVRDEDGSVVVAGSNGEDGRHSVALITGPGIVVGRKGSAGKVTWFNQDFWPIDTTYFVRHNPEITDLRWLYYLLSFAKLDRLNKTTGVPGLNRNDAYSERCNLPPLSEQSRIVELLDEADRLRMLHRKADVNAARILPTLFLKMFGDPVVNPKAWPLVCIGDLTTLVTSGSTPRGGAEVYVSEGPYIIRSQNVLMNRLRLSDAARITDEMHQQMSRTWVSIGDVLLNITGASIGRVAWVRELDAPANVNQHVCIIRPNSNLVNPAFLSACLSLPSMQSTIDGVQIGASRQALNHVQVRHLKIPTPPVAIQSQFALQANTVEGLLEKGDSVSGKLNSLWDTLMTRAFSGQLTAKWREDHLMELLAEMGQQTRLLNQPLITEMETTA